VVGFGCQTAASPPAGAAKRIATAIRTAQRGLAKRNLGSDVGVSWRIEARVPSVAMV
jgi:hypothetical protein